MKTRSQHTTLHHRCSGTLLTAVSLSFALASPLSGQEPAQEEVTDRIAWLRDHTISLRTIEAGSSDDSDLLPILPYLEGVRLVLLGEQSHADGATFMAKDRLIRFLHGRAGFDVLAFEANQEALQRFDRHLAVGDTPSIVDAPLPAMWKDSEFVRPLLHYVRGTRTGTDPIALAGFDIQLYRGGAPEAYLRTLRQRLRASAPSLLETDEWTAVEEIFGRNGPLAAQPDQVGRHEFQSMIDAARRFRDLAYSSTLSEAADPTASLALRLLDNLVWELRSRADRLYGNTEQWTGIRDRAMADNLLWLARDAYPGRRLIAWGHSGHMAKQLSGVEVLDGAFSWAGETPAGEYVAREMGDRAYSVGFLAFDGEWGQVFPDTSFTTPLPPAPPGSLDWLLAQVGEPYLFLDLRSVPDRHWLRTELVARPVYTDMRAVWPDVFDGIVFIRTMFPNRRTRPLEGRRRLF